jgi:hypothetical protein
MRRATAPVPPIAVYNSGRRSAVPTMQDVPNVGQLLGMAIVEDTPLAALSARSPTEAYPGLFPEGTPWLTRTLMV